MNLQSILSDPSHAHAYLLVSDRAETLTAEVEQFFAQSKPELKAFAHFLVPVENKIDIEDTKNFRQVFGLQAVTELSLGIIYQVDKMTLPAQQMLLKLLEEAPPRVVFILTTTKPRLLPRPVLSRVQVLHVTSKEFEMDPKLLEALVTLFSTTTLLYEKQQLIEKLSKKYSSDDLFYYISHYLWSHPIDHGTLQKWLTTVSYVRHDTHLRLALEYFFLT